MHYLSMCAIFKWEWSWLIEWVEYYRLLGVEHFYLYCNDDDPLPAEDILSPYISSGILDLFHIPLESPQMLCYGHAISLAQGRTFWLACVDLDEFILPVVNESISELLVDYESESALLVNERIFGSSWLWFRPPSQTKFFIRRAEDGFLGNQYVKVILRPERVRGFTNPHQCLYKEGFWGVNESHEKVDAYLSRFSARKVVVNHYFVRSNEDYAEKECRSRAFPGEDSRALRKNIKIPPDYRPRGDRNEVLDTVLPTRFPYDEFSGTFARLVAVRPSI